MKKLLIYLSSFAILLSAFLTPIATKAQVVSLPGIYVQDLSLMKSEYKAGDTVSGTFTLWNSENTTIPNIYYMVLLMGGYKDTIPQIQYDRTIATGPINLSAGERRMVSFSYTLPKGISGKDLGIQVHATMQNGTGLGWADSMINISGGSGFLTFSSSYIEVGKNKFGLQDGPMVYDGEKVSLKVNFKNDSSSAVTATPRLKIYDRSETGILLRQTDESVITVKSKSEISLNIELPTFKYDPKVYVGRLDLVDSSGNLVAPGVDFRYIVYGDIVTINNVTVNRESAKKGEFVVVKVDYSGAPFDILNGNTATSTPADFILKISNESGIEVASYSDKTDFNKGTQKIVNIPLNNNAKVLNISLTASKGEKILAKYNTTFSGDLGKNSDISTIFSLKNISIVILIIIVLIIFIFIKHFSERRVLLVVLIALLVASVATLLFVSDVRAVVDTYSSGGDGSIYNVFSQVSPSSADIGTTRTLQVSAYANACSNRGMKFTITANGISKSISRDQYSSNAMFLSNSVNFTGASTVGVSSVGFSARVDNFDHSNWASLTGHQDYTVTCPALLAPTVTVSASSSCQGGIVISWTSVSGANGYKIYKDGGSTSVAAVSSTTLSYNDTSVAVNESHSYVVKATNTCRESVASNSSTANSAPLCPITDPMRGIVAYGSTERGACAGKIDVAWSPVQYASYYNIYRYDPISGVVENTASTSNTTFRDTVDPGTVHKYAVQAFNAVSQSIISPLKSATSTYDCTPNMVTACYAMQDGIPTLNARAGIPVIWMAQISGGIEPYNYTWSGTDSLSESGTATEGVVITASKTYTNVSAIPVRKIATISANSGEDAYYRDTSANCYVDIWNTIGELSTSTLLCNVAPSSGSLTKVNQPINWSVSIPSIIVASTTIYWQGTDGLSGSTAIVPKIYTTVGLKRATSTVFGKDSEGAPFLGSCATSTNVVSGGGVQEQ